MDFYLKKMACNARSLLLLSLLTSCSATSVYDSKAIKQFKNNSCSVQVFYSKQAAEELGKIDEVCVVEGSSVMSFDHSLDGAINKNLAGLCKCGVQLAYVASTYRESDMGFKGLSYVTLIGFKLK